MHALFRAVLAIVLVASCAAPGAGSPASGVRGVSTVTDTHASKSPNADARLSKSPNADARSSNSPTASGILGPAEPSLFLRNSVVTLTVGARLDPPPRGSRAVPVGVAKAELERRFGPLSSAFKPFLALYSDTSYGDIGTDDSVKPDAAKILVWAFIATDVPAAPGANYGAALGPDGKAHPASVAPHARCSAVWTVDATTGTYLNGSSRCS